MSPLRTSAPIGLGLGLALLLAGCGGGTTTPQAAGATGNAAAPSSAPQPARTPGAGGGGVSGTIAYVSGQLMQVQDTSMQSAVTWTGTTTISKETAGTLADVTAGRCVVATSFTATQGGTGTSTAAPTVQPTVDPNAPATRVIVTDPVNGACQVGGFGGGGAPTGQARGVPTARPSGGAGGFGAARAAGIHTGLVTGVAGDTVSIQTTGQNGTKGTATFTVGSATTYTTTVKADASAIVVGQCASAFGPADTSGQVTATSITVSAPVNGTCTSFSANRAGGFGGRNRGGAGTGSTGTQGGSNA
jgi:hypothetical protein